MKNTHTRRQLVLTLAMAMGIATANATTHYWDNNGATAAFGTAGGTWSSAGTVGSGTQGWSGDSTGATLPAGTITTTTADALNFGSSTAGTVAISGTVDALSLRFGSSGTAAVTLGTTSNRINLASSGATITNTASNSVLNASLATTGNLLINGTNVAATNFFLNGANTIGGEVTIGGNNNIVLLGASNSFAGATKISVTSGNNIRYSGSVNISATTSYDLSSTGPGSRGAISFYNNNATSTLAGAINLSANSSIDNRDTVTLSGNITESGGARTLSVSNSQPNDTSTMTLSGNNTFSGGFTLIDNTGNATTIIRAGSSTAFGTGTLTMGIASQYTTGSAIIDLNGRTVSVGGLTGGQNAGHFIQNNSATSATLDVNQSATTTFQGVIRNNTGTVALTKSGSGSLTLSGVNTHTGGTTVTSGTLIVSGSGSINRSDLSVSSLATFRNTSSVAFSNDLTVAEGALFTGTTAAFTPTSLTLSATLADGFNGINFVSSLTKAGLLTVNLGSTAVGTYTLISSGTLGSFSSVTISGTALASSDGGASFTGNDGVFNYTYANAGNALQVSAFSAVPEPSTYATLAGLGILGFAVSRRRTNRV